MSPADQSRAAAPPRIWARYQNEKAWIPAWDRSVWVLIYCALGKKIITIHFEDFLILLSREVIKEYSSCILNSVFIFRLLNKQNVGFLIWQKRFCELNPWNNWTRLIRDQTDSELEPFLLKNMIYEGTTWAWKWAWSGFVLTDGGDTDMMVGLLLLVHLH